MNLDGTAAGFDQSIVELIAKALFEEDDSIRLKIHVATNKGRSRFKVPTSRGIEVDVAAPAVEGRANREVMSLISKTLEVKVAQIEIAGGEHSRNKVVKISQANKEKIVAALLKAIKR